MQSGLHASGLMCSKRRFDNTDLICYYSVLCFSSLHRCKKSVSYVIAMITRLVCVGILGMQGAERDMTTVYTMPS